MRTDAVTPLVLTYNEEPNIARTLARLSWAKRILVVDSFSTDRTLDIVSADPRVDVVQRQFDTFAGQCNAALARVQTEWVLSLDADYACGEGLPGEIRALPDSPAESGFSAAFVYCVHGRALRGTLYPRRTVLYRRSAAKYQDDGHAHRVVIAGSVGRLRTPIYHDDRKPLSAWLQAQDRYADREVEKLLAAPGTPLSRADRLRRRIWVMPLLVVPYCLFARGLIFDGAAGWTYTMQRLYAELLLALKLTERKLSA